jgi:PAS domain S-box-containing protein
MGLRLPAVVYVLALLAGLALALGFARFNSIHGEFLDANFDAIHGARTLLKARYFLGQAEERLTAAARDPERRAQWVALTFEALDLAESYGSEGRDPDPKVRAELANRMRTTRETLSRLQGGMAGSEAELDAAARDIHRLASEYEVAELDRWGSLSSLNSELAGRMEQMRLFVVAIVAGFLLLMAFLGWALLRAHRAGLSLRKAIEEVEAIQQTTLDASPLGIGYVDHAAERILLANQQAAAIFGYAPEELTKLPIAALHPDAAAYAAFSAAVSADLERGLVPSREVLMRRRTGELFWCAVSGKAIETSGRPRRVVWTCEDISGRKAVEMELLAAREKAEAANRAKNDFLANVSHEIRTPFTGILGVLELLARTPLADKQKHYLGMAQESTRQLLAIVNDLLDISRIEAGKLSINPIDFEARQLFDEIAQIHEAAAVRKGLSFAYRFDAEPPSELFGDPVRLRQIVDNLLGNAVKFTERGGVELRVRCAKTDAARQRRLRVEVIDSGIGIAEDKKELIFDTFTQADTTTTRHFGGTGLGLSICRNLANLMNGRIGVDSTPGSGSRFWLELELALADVTPLPPSPATEPITLDLAGKRLLIADDADLNRQVMIESLADTGCELCIATNGREAVALAGSWHPHLILMDCQMPLLDGYAATREIRQRQPAGKDLPILAITAHAMTGDREKCLAAGMDDYLVKPIPRSQLFARIAFWLAPERAAANAKANGAETAYPQFDGRILLVDNDAGVREACRSLLEAMGCEVTTAASGEAAINASEQVDFDLVLMDCHMPGMDGWEATRAWRLRESGRPRTAIVAMTGSASAADLRRCRDAGMDDFLAKPFASDGLIALLSRWLGAPT